MSLLGIAILGKKNEPLYLSDCARMIDENAPSNIVSDQHHAGDDDPFGFFSTLSGDFPADNLPLEYRFMIHAALDQLHEHIETTQAGLPVTKGRTGCWLGLLTQADEDAFVYGYISATNIKFMLLTRAGAKRQELRAFLTIVHELYIAYTMNPFAPTDAPIRSKRFDEALRSEVRDYDSNRSFEV